jgi:flagellar motor switch protein FliM
MSDQPNRPASVRRYVFYNEHRPSRAWMPTLEAVNHRFCQGLRTTLLQTLPPGIEVTPPIAIQLIPHGELMAKLTSLVHLTLVGLKPLHGAILVVADAPLISWIVECRFGGDGRFPIPTGNREFSVFERKCARRQVQTVVEQLVAAWQPIAGLEPVIMRHETNADAVSIAHSAEQIIVSVFDVRIRQGGGKLTLCIPYSMLEPLHDRLVGDADDARADPDPHWQAALRSRLEQAGLMLRVELTKLQLTVADLVNLRPGQVFDIDSPGMVTVDASGVPLFRGRWGKHGRKLGVMIEERLPALVGATPAMAQEGREERGDDQQ